MKKLLIAITCCLPLCANAVNKCEVNGHIEYTNSPCPSGTSRPIVNGTFTAIDTTDMSRQARIMNQRYDAEKAMKRHVQAAQMEAARNQALMEQSQLQNQAQPAKKQQLAEQGHHWESFDELSQTPEQRAARAERYANPSVQDQLDAQRAEMNARMQQELDSQRNQMEMEMRHEMQHQQIMNNFQQMQR